MPATAAALAHANARAKILRTMPDQVLAPELRHERDRLLDVHLTDLLTAHRDARIASTASADTTLLAGLEAVGNEIERLIASGQTTAGQALEVQGRFLDQRYPSDPLESSADVTTSDATLIAATDASIATQSLTPDEVDAILPKTVPAALPEPADERRVWPWWLMAIVLIALVAIVFGVSALFNRNVDADRAMMRGKVDVVASIDHLHRIRSTQDYGESATTAVFGLHGTVRNRADRPLQLLDFEIDLLSCETPATPVSRCTPIKTISTYAEGLNDLPAGLTVHFRQQVQEPLPDVTGYLRAVLRKGDVLPGEPRTP